MITNRLPKRLIQLITYILIIAFLGQNFSWADGPATPLLSLRKETEGLVLMPDNKGILSEFTESFANVPDPCKAWTTFNSRHPSFVESIERLTADEKALLKEFVIVHRDNLPGCALLLFSTLLGTELPPAKEKKKIHSLYSNDKQKRYILGPDGIFKDDPELQKMLKRAVGMGGPHTEWIAGAPVINVNVNQRDFIEWYEREFGLISEDKASTFYRAYVHELFHVWIRGVHFALYLREYFKNVKIEILLKFLNNFNSLFGVILDAKGEAVKIGQDDLENSSDILNILYEEIGAKYLSGLWEDPIVMTHSVYRIGNIAELIEGSLNAASKVSGLSIYDLIAGGVNRLEEVLDISSNPNSPRRVRYLDKQEDRRFYSALKKRLSFYKKKIGAVSSRFHIGMEFAQRLSGLGVVDVDGEDGFRMNAILREWVRKRLKRMKDKPEEFYIVVSNLRLRVNRQSGNIEEVTDGVLTEEYENGRFKRKHKFEYLHSRKLPVLKYDIFPVYGEFGLKKNRLSEREENYRYHFITVPLGKELCRIMEEESSTMPVERFQRLVDTISNNLVRLQEASLRELANEGIIPEEVLSGLLDRRPFSIEQLARSLYSIIITYHKAGFSWTVQKDLLARFIPAEKLGAFMGKNALSQTNAVNILFKYTWSETSPDDAVALAGSLVDKYGVSRSDALGFVSAYDEPEEALEHKLELARQIHERHMILKWVPLKEKGKRKIYVEREVQVPFSDAFWFVRKYKHEKAEQKFVAALDIAKRHMDTFDISYSIAMFYIKTYGEEKSLEKLEGALEKAEQVQAKVNKDRDEEKKISMSDIIFFITRMQDGLNRIESRIRQVLADIDKMMAGDGLTYRAAMRVKKGEISLEEAIHRSKIGKNTLEEIETRMLAEDYPDRLIEEYKEAVREWERSLKASSAQHKRKNFKILINAYNDSPRLNSLLESIYEELVAFEYGKGIEICVIEHSDKPEECDLNRKYVELWNTELQNKGRTDWMFRYVSLEEQYGLVKEINRNTGVNIETEFLYCSRAAQSPSDLAGRGFASAVNMALLWAQTKIDPEDKDSLVMFFDQDVEIGALINGDNGIRKRKITHTFHYISRAFDDMEVNMLACRLNGDPANSLDGLIGGHNERGAFHSFRHFLQRAIEAEDIDSMCDFWEYFYATEDDPERLSYRDMMQRMLKELENIKGGKYTAFKVLHNKRGRKPVTESGRSDTAPFGTGFVIRPDIAGKVPLFEVIRGSDIYYQIFLKYFVENKICTINIPVIHNKNPELNKPLVGDLHRLFSSNIGGNSTHLWVNRKIANGKGRVEGLFTHPDMIRLEAGADTEFVEAFIKAFKSDLRKYLLEAEKIYELLKNPALYKFGIDLGQAKAFFSEFIRAAREVLNIDEGEYCSDTAFDTMAQMQEWPEKIQLWQEVMARINKGSREEEEIKSHRFRKDLREALEEALLNEGFQHGRIRKIMNVGLAWTEGEEIYFEEDSVFEVAARVLNMVLRKGKDEQITPEQVKAAAEYHEMIHLLLRDNRKVIRKVSNELDSIRRKSREKLFRYFSNQYGIHKPHVLIEELIASYYTEKILINSLELLDNEGELITIEEIDPGIGEVIETHIRELIDKIRVGRLKFGNALQQLNEARRRKKIHYEPEGEVEEAEAAETVETEMPEVEEDRVFIALKNLFGTEDTGEILMNIEEGNINLEELHELLNAFSDRDMSAEEIMAFLKEIGILEFPPKKRRSIWARLPVSVHNRFIERLLEELDRIKEIIKAGKKDDPLIGELKATDKGNRVIRRLSVIEEKVELNNLRQEMFYIQIGRIPRHLSGSFYNYYNKLRKKETPQLNLFEFIFQKLGFIAEEKKLPTPEEIEQKISEEFKRGSIQKEPAHAAIFRLCAEFGIKKKSELRGEVARLFFTYRFYEILKEIKKKIGQRLTGKEDEKGIKQIRKQELKVLRSNKFKLKHRDLQARLYDYYDTYKAVFEVNKDKITQILGFEVDYDKYIRGVKDSTSIVAWLKRETEEVPDGFDIHVGKGRIYTLLYSREIYINLTQLEQGDYWISFQQDKKGQNKYAIIWESEEAEEEGAEPLQKFQIVKDGQILAQKREMKPTGKKPIQLMPKENQSVLIRKFLLEDGPIPPGFEVVVKGYGKGKASGKVPLCGFTWFGIALYSYLYDLIDKSVFVTFEEDQKGNKYAVVWKNREASLDKDNPYGYLRKFYLVKDGEVLNQHTTDEQGERVSTWKGPIIYTWKDHLKVIIEGEEIRPEKIASGEAVEFLARRLLHPDSNIVNNVKAALREWTNAQEGVKVLLSFMNPGDITEKGVARSLAILDVLESFEINWPIVAEYMKLFEVYPDDKIGARAAALRKKLIEERQPTDEQLETIIRSHPDIKWNAQNDRHVIVEISKDLGQRNIPVDSQRLLRIYYKIRFMDYLRDLSEAFKDLKTDEKKEMVCKKLRAIEITKVHGEVYYGLSRFWNGYGTIFEERKEEIIQILGFKIDYRKDILSLRGPVSGVQPLIDWIKDKTADIPEGFYCKLTKNKSLPLIRSTRIALELSYTLRKLIVDEEYWVSFEEEDGNKTATVWKDKEESQKEGGKYIQRFYIVKDGLILAQKWDGNKTGRSPGPFIKTKTGQIADFILNKGPLPYAHAGSVNRGGTLTLISGRKRLWIQIHGLTGYHGKVWVSYQKAGSNLYCVVWKNKEDREKHGGVRGYINRYYLVKDELILAQWINGVKTDRRPLVAPDIERDGQFLLELARADRKDGEWQWQVTADKVGMKEEELIKAVIIYVGKRSEWDIDKMAEMMGIGDTVLVINYIDRIVNGIKEEYSVLLKAEKVHVEKSSFKKYQNAWERYVSDKPYLQKLSVSHPVHILGILFKEMHGNRPYIDRKDLSETVNELAFFLDMARETVRFHLFLFKVLPFTERLFLGKKAAEVEVKWQEYIKQKPEALDLKLQTLEDRIRYLLVDANYMNDEAAQIMGLSSTSVSMLRSIYGIELVEYKRLSKRLEAEIQKRWNSYIKDWPMWQERKLRNAEDILKALRLEMKLEPLEIANILQKPVHFVVRWLRMFEIELSPEELEEERDRRIRELAKVKRIIDEEQRIKVLEWLEKNDWNLKKFSRYVKKDFGLSVYALSILIRQMGIEIEFINRLRFLFKKHNGIKQDAAKSLKIIKDTFYRILEELGIAWSEEWLDRKLELYEEINGLEEIIAENEELFDAAGIKEIKKEEKLVQAAFVRYKVKEFFNSMFKEKDAWPYIDSVFGTSQRLEKEMVFKYKDFDAFLMDEPEKALYLVMRIDVEWFSNSKMIDIPFMEKLFPSYLTALLGAFPETRETGFFFDKSMWHRIAEVVLSEKEYQNLNQRLWSLVYIKGPDNLEWDGTAKMLGVSEGEVIKAVFSYFINTCGGDIEEIKEKAGLDIPKIEHYLEDCGLAERRKLIFAQKKAKEGIDLAQEDWQCLFRELIDAGNIDSPEFIHPLVSLREQSKGIQFYFYVRVEEDGFIHLYSDKRINAGFKGGTWVKVDITWDRDYGWLLNVYKIGLLKPVLTYRIQKQEDKVSFVSIDPAQQTFLDYMRGEEISPRENEIEEFTENYGRQIIVEIVSHKRFRDRDLPIYPFTIRAEPSETQIRFGEITIRSENIKPDELYRIEPVFIEKQKQWVFFVFDIKEEVITVFTPRDKKPEMRLFDNDQIEELIEERELLAPWQEINRLNRKMALARDFREKDMFQKRKRKYIEILWSYIKDSERKKLLKWREAAEEMGIDKDELRRVVLEGWMEIAGGDMKELARIMGLAEISVKMQYISPLGLTKKMYIRRALAKAQNNEDLDDAEKLEIMRELFEKEEGRYFRDSTFPGFSFITRTRFHAARKRGEETQGAYVVHLYTIYKEKGKIHYRMTLTEGILERYGNKETEVRVKTSWDPDYGWLFDVYEIDPVTKENLRDIPDLRYRVVLDQFNPILIDPSQQTVLDSIEPKVNIFGMPISLRSLSKNYMEGWDGPKQIVEMTRYNRFETPGLKLYPFYMTATKAIEKGMFSFGKIVDESYAVGRRVLNFASTKLTPEVLYQFEPYFSLRLGRWIFLVCDFDKPVLAFSGWDEGGITRFHQLSEEEISICIKEKEEWLKLRKTADLIIIREEEAHRLRNEALHEIRKAGLIENIVILQKLTEMLREKISAIKGILTEVETKTILPGQQGFAKKINGYLSELKTELNKLEQIKEGLMKDTVKVGGKDLPVWEVELGKYNRFLLRLILENPNSKTASEAAGALKLLKNEERIIDILRVLDPGDWSEAGKRINRVLLGVLEDIGIVNDQVLKRLRGFIWNNLHGDVGEMAGRIYDKLTRKEEPKRPEIDKDKEVEVIKQKVVLLTEEETRTARGICRVGNQVVVEGFEEFGVGKIIAISVEEDRIAIDFPIGRKIFVLSEVKNMIRESRGKSFRGWVMPPVLDPDLGILVFVAALTWQNNPQLVYIKDIWDYLMLRIWDIRKRLGLVKAAQPEEPEVVESGPSFEEPEVAEEVPSVEAVDVVLDTNSTPSRKLRNLRNRMRRLLDREVINPELLETIVREMEVLLARYEHLHLTNQPLYQEFEELRQTVEALLKKAAEPESEPELEEAPLPVEKPPSPEPESRPRRRRRRRNVWAELMPGPERDMGMYLEGRFRPAIVENMVEEGMRYIKRGVLREGAGAVQLAEYLAILRKNNFTGQRQKPVLLIYHEGALFRIRDRDGNIVGVIPNLIVLKRGSTEEGGMGFMHMKKHFPEFDGMSVEQILEWLARTIKDGLVRKYMIQKEKKGLVGNKEYSLYRDDTGQAYRAIVSDDDYVVTFYTEYFKDFGLSELLDVRPEEALLLIKRLSDRVRVEIYDLLPNPAEIGDLVRGYRKAGRTIQAIRRRIYYYPGTAKRDPFIGIWNHSRMEMVLMDFTGNVFDAVNSKSLKGYHRTEITSIVHRADMYYLEKNESGERQMISKGSGAPNIAVATSGMYTQEQHDKTNQKIKNDMENEDYISCKLETDMRIEIGENIEINGNELAERMREVITGLDPETQEALQEVSLFLVQPDDPEHPYCLRTETIDGRLEYQVAHAGSNRGRGCFIYLTIPAFMDFPASLLNKIIVREINFAKERLACRKQGLEIPDDIDGYTSEVAEILDRIKQFEMLASDDKKEQFYRFCERLSEMMKEIYPGVELPGAETLWEIIHNGRLPSDWPGLVSAMRKDGVIDDEDFEVVTKVGKAVEQANQDAKLTVSEMAMLTETISIKYLLESRGLRDEFEEKLRNRLYVLGYGSKAGRIIALLAGLKKKGRFNRRSHFDFVKRLEKLLGRGDIFKEIGISRNVSSSDIMGNGDDSVTRYWADIFELNGKQWEVLELLRDKNPSGIIVQDIRGFGSGVGNWLEGIRRCGVNMSGVRMAYIIDNEVNESDRQKLIAEKPDNVILVYSLEEIRKQSDNIVYLAVGKKLNDHIGTGIKLVEKGHAGPIIELSLCLLMLATDNTRGAYKEFLNKMASLDLISREQVGELSDPYYIKLPDVRAEVLKMWKDLEQGTSFLDFWA